MNWNGFRTAFVICLFSDDNLDKGDNPVVDKYTMERGVNQNGKCLFCGALGDNDPGDQLSRSTWS